MNNKQVLILWILAALLGGAVAAVKISQSRGPDTLTKFARGERLFESIPVHEITSIKVADPDGTATLEKTEEGWVVKERGDYPADIPMLAGLLDTLGEVKVGQGLEAGPRYNTRFGLDEKAATPADHGIHLTLSTGGGKQSWTIALGKSTAGEDPMADPMAPPVGGGRFVRFGEDPGSVYVVEETFPRLSAKPKDWLKSDFLQVTKIKSITLRAPKDSGFEPWNLTRENADGELVLTGLSDQEELLANAVSPMKSLFSFARFEDVLTPEKAAELRDDLQSRQAIISTFDGFTYTVEVAPKKSADTADTAGSDPNYLLSVSIAADLPATRTAPEGESEEDKKKNDEAFAKERKALEEKLAKEQKLQGRNFEVTKWTVDSLLKSRAEIVGPKAAPPAPPEPQATPGLEDAFGFPEE